MGQTGKRPPTYLRPAERDQLLAAVEAAGTARDKAILALFLFAGCRRNELRMLDRSDINFRHRELTIRYAKGGKTRKLRLHPLPLAALQAYMLERRDDDPALFISNRRQRIANRTLTQVLDRYTSGLDLGKVIRLHSLRHTFATQLYKSSGKDLQIVQRALGHSNIATTTIYTHLADDELDEAIDKL